MSSQDKKAVKTISGKELLPGLRILECAYGYDLPEKRAAVYLDFLGGKFTEKQFSALVKKVIETKPRFPAISDIIEVSATEKFYDNSDDEIYLNTLRSHGIEV